jgi:hypothetical protein
MMEPKRSLADQCVPKQEASLRVAAVVCGNLGTRRWMAAKLNASFPSVQTFRAFTFIEFLAVIALLAALSLPSLRDAR